MNALVSQYSGLSSLLSYACNTIVSKSLIIHSPLYGFGPLVQITGIKKGPLRAPLIKMSQLIT